MPRATGRKHSEYLWGETSAEPAYTRETFAELLLKSRTFVFNGNCLEDENFVEQALPEVKVFHEHGGTVVMIGGDAERINEDFDCSWRGFERSLLHRMHRHCWVQTWMA